MTPFGFLPPFGVGDAEHLRQIRDHQAMLAEEWRLANAGRHGAGMRARAGRLLVSFVCRILTATARLLAAARRATRPKAGLKVRHSQPGC
jgi:hypothetical protein